MVQPSLAMKSGPWILENLTDFSCCHLYCLSVSGSYWHFFNTESKNFFLALKSPAWTHKMPFGWLSFIITVFFFFGIVHSIFWWCQCWVVVVCSACWIAIKCGIVTAVHWFWYFRCCCMFPFYLVACNSNRIFLTTFTSEIWLEISCWHINHGIISVE